jgi:hypothetical protein
MQTPSGRSICLEQGFYEVKMASWGTGAPFYRQYRRTAFGVCRSHGPTAASTSSVNSAPGKKPKGGRTTESTRRLLGNLFELEDLGAKDLKGLPGPVRAWAALRASSVESRFEAPQHTDSAALNIRSPALSWPSPTPSTPIMTHRYGPIDLSQKSLLRRNLCNAIETCLITQSQMA